MILKIQCQKADRREILDRLMSNRRHLVKDNLLYMPLLGSKVLVAQNVGIIVTALIFMQLSDSYGRVPIFHITNIIYIGKENF